jgi:hypothetical protein
MCEISGFSEIEADGYESIGEKEVPAVLRGSTSLNQSTISAKENLAKSRSDLSCCR